MQVRRVISQLQGAAEIHQWMIRHVPHADSAVGHDLFLKIGNTFLSGARLDLKDLCTSLPYPEKSVRLQVRKATDAGLLARQVTGLGDENHKLLPTRKFLALLEAYQRELESVFIPRKDLRARQLHVSLSDLALTHLVETIYDHFYDLGWLYLHNFGSTCFAVASLLQRVAKGRGHQAELQTGYVEVMAPNGSKYLLGAQGYSQPGQIEGHAYCLIDGSAIVDFGLGNVRKRYRSDFYWAMACDRQTGGPVAGQVILPSGEQVRWKTDWQSPDAAAEFQRCEQSAERLFQHYLSCFGDTLSL